VTRLRTATSDTFRSLHVRNFRLFFTGQLISQVGNWLTLVAQTLLVLKLTDNGVALGALAAAQFGPVLVIGPGRLIADRSDKRRLLLIVQTIAMAQSFVLAGLAFSGHPRCSRSTRWPWSGRDDRVRQPGPPRLRGRDGARGQHPQRRQPQQRAHDVVARRRPAVAGLLVATVGSAGASWPTASRTSR